MPAQVIGTFTAASPGPTTATLTAAITTLAIVGERGGADVLIEGSYDAGTRWAKVLTASDIARSERSNGIMALGMPAGWRLRVTVANATAATDLAVAVE